MFICLVSDFIVVLVLKKTQFCITLETKSCYLPICKWYVSESYLTANNLILLIITFIALRPNIAKFTTWPRDTYFPHKIRSAMFRILYAFRICYSLILFSLILKQEMNSVHLFSLPHNLLSLLSPLFPLPCPLCCVSFSFVAATSFHLLLSLPFPIVHFYFTISHAMLCYLIYFIISLLSFLNSSYLVLSCLILSYLIFFSSVFFFSIPLSFSFSFSI